MKKSFSKKYRGIIMGKRITLQRRYLVSYLSASLAIIIIWLFLQYGPLWHRNIVESYEQQMIPLKWYEYLQILINNMLIFAFYGIFAAVPLLRIRSGRLVGNTFIRWSIVVGVFTTLVAAIGGLLLRMDCGDSCVNHIPSYLAINLILLITAIVCVVLPVLALARMRQVKSKTKR